MRNVVGKNCVVGAIVGESKKECKKILDGNDVVSVEVGAGSWLRWKWAHRVRGFCFDSNCAFVCFLLSAHVSASAF